MCLGSGSPPRLYSPGARKAAPYCRGGSGGISGSRYLEERLEVRQNIVFGSGPGYRIHQLTIFKEKQCGNGADIEAIGQTDVTVHIHFADLSGARHFRGYLVYNG